MQTFTHAAFQERLCYILPNHICALSSDLISVIMSFYLPLSLYLFYFVSLYFYLGYFF